ncbi:MAG: hypothetical protein QMD80_00105 [archaeon]|nr:hypothetical protein [archaeon]
MFKKYLFAMDWDSELEYGLKNRSIPEKLKNKLEKKGLPLPEKPDIKEEDDKWVIINKKKKENCYTLRRVQEELYVYKVLNFSSFSDKVIDYNPNLEKGDPRLEDVKQFYKKHGKKYERVIEILCKGFGEFEFDDEKLATKVARHVIPETRKDLEFKEMLEDWKRGGSAISGEEDVYYRFYFGALLVGDG